MPATVPDGSADHPPATLEEALETIRRAQNGKERPLSERVAAAVEHLVADTETAYTRDSALYAERRGQSPSSFDEELTGILLASMRDSIDRRLITLDGARRWRLLDVGAATGRDFQRFLEEPDVCVVAVDNAAGFLDRLRSVASERGLPDESVIAADMRDLSQLQADTFHCVRSHATLHHLPVVAAGVGADCAVAETRRILVPGGIFYILVKAGSGVALIDTHEGFGRRFYQLFAPELLDDLLSRHGFTVMRLETRTSVRPTGDVQWLFCLARAT